ncbi:hypothetical protein VIGAN_09109300 [Vigna angularis var. angularis]|uniref:Uncharacterized protein n=1 Tax=Vigna angularis var. angularis TaxID=157739 RepID=A0A0S3SXK5_PHAAN|nr:hypothetical protein VIGAN_09109300 [Vigna angularis var. angularis]
MAKSIVKTKTMNQRSFTFQTYLQIVINRITYKCYGANVVVEGVIMVVVDIPSLSPPSSPAAHRRKILNSVAAFRRPLTLPTAMSSQIILSTPGTAASSPTTSDPPFRHMVTSVAAALSLALSDPSLRTAPSRLIPAYAAATATNPPLLTTASRIVTPSSGIAAMTSAAIDIAPPSTRRATVSLSAARLSIAASASRLAPSGPLRAKFTKPLTTRVFLPNFFLCAGTPDKLNTVAAALAFASHVTPDSKTSAIPFNAPSVSIILVLFASRIDKFSIVVTALTCRLGFSIPTSRNRTKSGIAPASAIQARLSESVFAKTRSS